MSWTTDVVKRVLPNGLTVLAQRDRSAAVVAVVTHVKAGYFDEPDEWVGIAHVLEHMFFKGTARRKPGEIARDTQLMGGYLNAATIYDKTIYYTVLPSTERGLAQALDIQSDALINAALDSGELERELEVIIQEAKRKLDSPHSVAGETLYQLLFSKHRMRRWRLGTEAGLRSLTAANLRSYYTSRYTPGRVVVGIVGDLNVEEALCLAEEYYGDWDQAEAVVGRSPEEPDQIEPNTRVVNGDVTRPLAVVGWRTVGALHEWTPALDVAAVVLGNGRGSRLYRGVRLAGLANSVGSSHYTPTEVGVFDISLEGDSDTFDDAVERSMRIVSQLIERGADESELARARALLATRWARQFESMDGRAGALCEAEALGGYELADELYGRTMAVTVGDVTEAAAMYLRPAAASAVFYLPDGMTTSVANGGWPLGAVSYDLDPPASVAASVGEPKPRGESIESMDLGGVIHYPLPGIDLLVSPKLGAGLVSIILSVPGVPGMETEDNAGVSSLLVRVALKGAGGMTGNELAQTAEVLGGGIRPAASVDGLGWAVSVRADSARAAARLLRSVALEPNLKGGDIAVERALQAGDARRLRDDMYGHPARRVLAKAYEPDAYGLPMLGDPFTVEEITDEEVRSWQTRLCRSRAVAIVVGDLTVDELRDSLEPLSDWPTLSETMYPLAPSPLYREGVGFEHRKKEQSALAMAFPAKAGGSSDRHGLVVMCALLSGLAGRLFDELRERRSLAYTVAATPWLKKRAGAVITYIATSPDREEEAHDAMIAELERLASEVVPDGELARARNYAAGLVEIGRQSGASVADEILRAWINGTLEGYVATPQALRSVTSEEVYRVSAAVFGTGKRAEYVVRGGLKSE